MGFVESAGFALALPALQAMMTEGRSPRELGRVQGLYATCQTGAITISAATAGAMFGVRTFLPFLVAAGIGFVLIAGLIITWAPLQGKVAHAPTADAS